MKARVRPTHNYGGAHAGSIVHVQPEELERWPDVLEPYPPPADPRGPRPTVEAIIAEYGEPKDARDRAELERAVAHMQLDYDRGWGRFSKERLEEAALRRKERDEDLLEPAPAIETRELEPGEKLQEGGAPASMTSTPIDLPPAVPSLDAEKVRTEIDPPKEEPTRPGKSKKGK